MDDFERGYEFAIRQGGGSYAAEVGAEYVREVEAAIVELYRRMNAYDYYKATKPAQESLKGFIAEEFAAGTANVDAAVKGSGERFAVLQSHDLGSVDVASTGGVDFQLKVYENPYQTVRALGTTLFDKYHGSNAASSVSFEEWAAYVGRAGARPSDLLYEGQFGLVAEDKLDACKNEVFKLIAKNKALGKESEVVRWEKVADSLTDRVRGDRGVEGRPMTVAEARRKAIDVSSGKALDPADDHMTASEVIRVQNVLQQSLKAGATAAVVSAALKVAPEIYRAIDRLIAEGELDEENIRAIGAATLDGGATGFVNGTATAAITAMACKGAFGQTIMGAASKAMGPTVIGTLVVMTIETCKDAYLMARGEKTQQDFADGVVQGAFTSAVTLVGAGIASIVTGGAAIPMLIGSIVGSAAGGLAFAPARSCVLKVARSSGFSFFGLVRQDYELPESTARELGIKRASFKEARFTATTPEESNVRAAKIRQACAHTIGFSYNERGVVGVNKIGYIAR